MTSCIDDATATKIVQFAQKILDALSNAKISDIKTIEKLIKEFAKGLNPEIGTCLKKDKEVAALADKYGITPSTDIRALMIKVAKYCLSHFSTVKGYIKDVNDLWSAGQYKKAGTKTAEYGHNIIKKHALEIGANGDGAATLQQAFNGAFQYHNLPAPTTIMQCIDPTSADKIANFISPLFEKLSKVSILNVKALIDMVKAFGKTIPKEIGACL
jgi:hypothetical protein